jgi:hypothetical protein
MKLKSAKLANAIRTSNSGDVSFHIGEDKHEAYLDGIVIKIKNKRDGFSNCTSLYNCIEWVLDETTDGGASVQPAKSGKGSTK